MDVILLIEATSSDDLDEFFIPAAQAVVSDFGDTIRSSSVHVGIVTFSDSADTIFEMSGILFEK